MALYPELDHLSLSKLIDAFHGSPPEADDYAAAFYDEVTNQIRERGEDGIRLLVDATSSATGDRLASLLVGLAPLQTAPPELGSILRRCLRDPAARVVMAAIDALRLQGDWGATEDVLSLRDHPSPLVRGAVLRYVRACCPDRAKSLLIAAIDDPDPIVRAGAIDELDALEIADASTILAPLLHDPDSDVRQAARLAIGDEPVSSTRTRIAR